jgi:hypothetical protein
LKRLFINSHSTVHKEKEMVDFRKAILLLAVLVFTTGIVSAQALNCTLNGGNPPILRAEGVAEAVGQAFISCQGGSALPQGSSVNRINIRVFLGSFNVTSRWIGGNSSQPMLESMLLIDDPLPADQVWGHTSWPSTLPCTAPYNPVNCGNVFAATLVAPNAIEWRDIPFEPTGTTTARTLRMVNIRVNAAKATGGSVSSLIPTTVQMYVAVSGLSITSPFLTVGYIQNGLSFSTSPRTLSFPQCGPRSTSNNLVPAGSFTVNFTEGFPYAFRPLFARDQNNNVIPQNDLNQVYYTESMYFPIANAAWSAGQATQGTRLRLKFTGIPANVVLVVPFNPSGSTWSVYAVDSNNFSTQLGLPNAVKLTNGEGEVVYEVSQASGGTTETISIPVQVYYSGLPGLSTPDTSVNGTFAPLSTSDSGNFNLSIPRFYQTTGEQVALSIAACETRLLFPFVASIPGYDTGLAIVNTSKDPFNTPKQKGACTLFFYGTPSDSSQTSAEIAAGQALTMILSQGNSAQNLQAVPNFVGYVIARCAFQYGHGYAFISDPGVNKFAQGYIALVLESSSGTLKRGPSNAVESLGN